MIEYALLFALGFLAATLTGLIVAPAIQRRIVIYTENRLKATMPLSPQEVRAQTDMARAAFAAENARVTQQLVREREKGTRLSVHNESLKQEVSRLAADIADLKTQVEELNVGAADLRSSLRHEAQRYDQLKERLDAAEREILHKKREIEILHANRDLVQTDLNDSLISLAARETELESLNSKILTLRHERDKLVDGLRASQASLKETGQRLSREETRSRQLEQRLSREVSHNADKDNALERRTAEINRLRDRLKGITADARASVRSGRAAEAKAMPPTLPEPPRIQLANGTGAARTGVADLVSLEADVRDRSAGISQRLAEAASPELDASLREQMAEVAARMIVLTDAREGTGSPIRSLLDQAAAPADPNRISLAQRAKDLLPPRE